MDRWEVKFFKWIVGRLLLFCLVLALLPTVLQLFVALLSAMLAFILPWVFGILVLFGCAAALGAILAFWCRFASHKGASPVSRERLPFTQPPVRRARGIRGRDRRG